MMIPPITSSSPTPAPPSSASSPPNLPSVLSSLAPAPPSDASHVIPIPSCAYSIRLSPFFSDLAAVATGQNFGIVGAGAQYIINLPLPVSQHPSVSRPPPSERQTPQATLDCCWSESSATILASSLANGAIYMYNVIDEVPRPPQMMLLGHSKEVGSLDWNISQTHLLLSASWDGSCRVWDTAVGREISVDINPKRTNNYCSVWAPTQPSIYATSSGSGEVSISDVRLSTGPIAAGDLGQKIDRLTTRRVLGFRSHDGETLSVDWNKYNPFSLVSCGTDSLIRLWDVRRSGAPLTTLSGHSLAVRKVRWSPYREMILASTSYDMSVGVWDTGRELRMIQQFNNHTEFVMGLEWSLFNEGILLSASWDKTVRIWDTNRKHVTM